MICWNCLLNLLNSAAEVSLPTTTFFPTKQAQTDCQINDGRDEKLKRKKEKDLEVERGKRDGVSRNNSAESICEDGDDILGDLVDQLHKVGGLCRLLHC